MIMRCGDNGGDLDGVLPINGAECASDHCILTSGSVGMIISIEFTVSLPFCAHNLARYSIGISDMKNMGNMEHTWMSCGVCYDTLIHELTRQTSARNMTQVLARHSSQQGGFNERGGDVVFKFEGQEMQQNQYHNEMGKTTIGVLPDSSNEPIAGVGNGEVQNIQWESIIIDIGKL